MDCRQSAGAAAFFRSEMVQQGLLHAEGGCITGGNPVRRKVDGLVIAAWIAGRAWVQPRFSTAGQCNKGCCMPRVKMVMVSGLGREVEERAFAGVRVVRDTS